MKSWSWVVNNPEHDDSLSKTFEGYVSLSFASKSNGAEILFFLKCFFFFFFFFLSNADYKFSWVL